MGEIMEPNDFARRFSAAAEVDGLKILLIFVCGQCVVDHNPYISQ